LIWGDQDTDTPLWQGQQLEKLIPDAGLVVFKGAGHFAFQERLNDFVRIVDTFFKDNSAGIV
jgi:pimeloyl-ACP methyl ester carboxylesterase